MAPFHIWNDIKSACSFVTVCYTRIVCIISFWMRFTTVSALNDLLDWSSQISSLALLLASAVLWNLIWISLHIGFFCENLKLKPPFWPRLPPFTLYCCLPRFVVISDFELAWLNQMATSLQPSVSQLEIWRKFHTISSHERVGCLSAQ